MELKYGLRQERAAKKGAKGVDSSAVAMEIGLADIHAKLTEQAWRQWGEEFHSRAAANERDDVPTYIARIMHRLHVGCWRLMCIPKNCECGNAVSFHQVLFSCTTCSDHLKPLTGSLHNAGLPLCTQACQCATSVRAGASLCCSQTGLHVSNGILSVVCGTPSHVQRFFAAWGNPGGGGRDERLRVPCAENIYS